MRISTKIWRSILPKIFSLGMIVSNCIPHTAPEIEGSKQTTVAINKTSARSLFVQADSNRDNNISERELYIAANSFPADETRVLKDAFSIQNRNTGNAFDKHPEMKLWEYMQAIGESTNIQIFTREEIQWANKDFVLEKVRGGGRWKAFEFADESLKKDETFVLEVIKLHGFAIKYADESLRKDKQFVLKAIKQSMYTLAYVDEGLKKDIEINLAAIKLYGHGILGFVNDNLRRDKEIIRAILMELLGKDYNEKILLKLIKLGIDFPHRLYKAKIINELIQNRDDLSKTDSRPLALFILPKKDSSDAFNTEYFEIEELIDRGYRVIYFEAETEGDFYSALESTGKYNRISLMVIGGHGTKSTLSFGAGDPAKSEIENENYYLDISDKQELVKRNLSRYFRPESMIILEGCSTGEGGKEGKNLANMLKEVFLESAIIAPIKPFPGFKYFIFNEKNQVIMMRGILGYLWSEKDMYIIPSSRK